MSTSSNIVKNISTAFIQLMKSQVFSDIKETTGVKDKYVDKIIEHLTSKVSDYEKIITENITSIVEEIEKTKKTSNKKRRKPKDPNAPKKNLNSFLLYCGDVREKFKTDNPNLKQNKMMEELGKKWKEFSDKKKNKYIKLAAQDKERYNEEMKYYTPSQEFLDKVEEWKSDSGSESGSDSESGKKKRSSKKKKDPNAPKRGR